MPRLKVLSSDKITKILKTFDFEIVNQKGSHIKFARITSFEKQILTIPNHQTLAKGTIKAIFNQLSRFVPQEKLAKHFYN